MSLSEKMKEKEKEKETLSHWSDAHVLFHMFNCILGELNFAGNEKILNLNKV